MQQVDAWGSPVGSAGRTPAAGGSSLNQIVDPWAPSPAKPTGRFVIVCFLLLSCWHV